MIYNRKYWITCAVLIVIGLIAAYVFRTNYSGRDGNVQYGQLSPAAFTKLAESDEERVWLYLYNRHEIKNDGLLPEDAVKRFYLVKDGKAKVYVPEVSLKLSELGNDLTDEVKKASVGGVELSESPAPYNFGVTESAGGVTIDIINENGLRDTYALRLEVPDDELVSGLKFEKLSLDGYYHSATSVDRFLKYQQQALITPASS